MGFLKVVGNNNVTIRQNGFIIVKGTIEVITSLVTTSSTSASEFENFTTDTYISDNTFTFDNPDVFVLEDETEYKSVTLSNNKIQFINDNYIELPSEINNSTTRFTKKETDSSTYYLLYKDVNDGLYDLLVIFDCTNNTIQVKQLYNEQQLGSDIDGEASGDRSGNSVSLSSDGTIVAIGASYNGGNGFFSGHVRVYEWRQYTQTDEDNSTYHYTSYIQESTQTNPLIITANTSTAPVVNSYYWTQLGSDIDGEASSDQSGNSVSLSSDGTIVAIGAYTNDGNGSNSGHVRVYEYKVPNQTNEWENSEVIIAGAIYDTNNNTRGTYDSNKNYWVQLGSDIDGETSGDQSGRSVSLSSNGTIVAIGAYLNAGNGTNSGHVRVYEYTNGSWTQLGSDIDGELGGDKSGTSVSLSSDGTIVAIGAYGHENEKGTVRVYEYTGGSWGQLGSDIDGELGGDLSGYRVSLSSDGTIVAIGAYYNDGEDNLNFDNRGHVRVYEYTNGSWDQLGDDIDGEAYDDRSGFSVSLSEDGTIVAIGAYNNDGNGSNSGHVRIYKYNETDNTWVKIYKDIDGEAGSDKSGYSVSLSSDGTIVAIGAYLNDGNGTSSGHVRVYNLSSNSIKETSSNTISSSNYVTIR